MRSAPESLNFIGLCMLCNLNNKIPLICDEWSKWNFGVEKTTSRGIFSVKNHFMLHHLTYEANILELVVFDILITIFRIILF